MVTFALPSPEIVALPPVTFPPFGFAYETNGVIAATINTATGSNDFLRVGDWRLPDI